MQWAARRPYDLMDTKTVLNTVLINNNNTIRNGHDMKRTSSFWKQIPIIADVLIYISPRRCRHPFRSINEDFIAMVEVRKDSCGLI